jgi:hypothetical protein
MTTQIPRIYKQNTLQNDIHAIVTGETPPESVYTMGRQQFLPQFADFGGEVLDFWSTVYVGGSERLAEFKEGVQQYMNRAGHKMKVANTSFASGVFRGKVRPFFSIRKGDVTALMYSGAHGADLKDIYTSIRVVYAGNLSFWKTLVLWIALTITALLPSLFFFIPMWANFGFTLATTRWNEYYQAYAEDGGYIINYTAGLNAYLTTLIIVTCVLAALYYMWSWWRYGDAQAFLRADLDELHRDDASAIGYDLYLAITNVANSFDLVQIPTQDIGAPVFGAKAQTTMQRRRRI